MRDRILPNSHVVSIDSIFGDDIDASVIVPKHRTAQSSAATFASQSLDMDQGEVGNRHGHSFLSFSLATRRKLPTNGARWTWRRSWS